MNGYNGLKPVATQDHACASVKLIRTAKRFCTVAQGRPELVEWRALGPDQEIIVYAEGVIKPIVGESFV